MLNMDNLNDFEREYIKEMMSLMDKGNNSLYDNIFADDYKFPLVTPNEFLDDPVYTGEGGKNLYPVLRKDFQNIFTKFGIFEVIIGGATRAGKSFVSQLCAARMLYEILALKKPQEFFKISPSSDIYIAIFSVNGLKAKSDFFDGVKRMLDSSPFFSQFRLKKDLETKVIFKLGSTDDQARGNLIFVSGNSSEVSAFGQNTIAGFLDEANFLPDIKNSKRGRSHGREDNSYNASMNLYNSVFRRMKNTYGTVYGTMPGKFFIISSQKHEKDFVNTRIKQVQDTNDKSVYIMRYASWETNPKYENAEKFNVGINHKTSRISKVLSDTDNIDDYERILKVPVIFKQDFVNDFFGAMCDLAGQPFYGKGKFINSLKIPIIFNKIIQPFANKDKVDFSYDDIVFDKNKIQYKNKPRFIHLDMAESGDNLGLAMGYLYGSKKVTKVEDDKIIDIDMPITAIDFLLTVVPPKEGKIDIDKIYQLFLRLKNLGIYINKITYDRFQTTYLMQRLAKMGFNVEYLSMDRLPCEPYHNLRDSIHQERLYCIDNDIIGDELGCLEKNDSGKIDHDAEGCFTGDTKIKMIDGNDKTMSELAENNITNFDIFSCDSKGNVFKAKAKKCWITKEVNSFIKITLDDASIIKCTPEHKFMLIDGIYVEAYDLQIGNVLMCLSITKRVKSIEVINLSEPIKVYDIEVPEYHNFALSAGIFVHNSKDLGDCIGGVNHSVLKYFIDCDFGNKPLIDRSDRQSMHTETSDSILTDFDAW